ncbi:MAG: hypothetical protein DLM68_16505, partial [Hyphomicrobiales bacterium]
PAGRATHRNLRHGLFAAKLWACGGAFAIIPAPLHSGAFALWNKISSCCAYLSAGALLYFCPMYDAFAKKPLAGDNPCGAGAAALEWTLSSPPPFYQIETLPISKSPEH